MSGSDESNKNPKSDLTNLLLKNERIPPTTGGNNNGARRVSYLRDTPTKMPISAVYDIPDGARPILEGGHRNIGNNSLSKKQGKKDS